MGRFVVPLEQAFDSAGDPLSGAKLYFYQTGTTTPLATYSDSGLSIANANPVVADSAGRFSNIFLTAAAHKVVLKTSADVTVWTADPVYGPMSAGSVLDLAGLITATHLTNDAGALQAITDKLAGTGKAAFLSSAASDLQAITTKLQWLPSGTGATSRTLAARFADWLSAKNFGATGDGTTNDRAALANAITAGASSHVALPAGTYRISSSLTFSVPVVFMPGAKLSIDAAQTATFSAGIVAPELSQLFTGSGTVAGLRTARPEWWGALRDGSTDDGPEIQAALTCVGAASGGEVLLSAGTYAVNSALTMSVGGVKLRGAGRTATNLGISNATMTVITVSGGAQHWEISGLTFLASSNQTAGGAIDCQAAAVGRIVDVRTYQMFTGVTLGNSVGTLIDHCEFSDFRGSGILINGSCNDVFISNCIMNGAEFATGIANPASTGIRMVDKAEAVMVHACEIIVCNEPLFMTGAGPGTGTTPAYCRFTDCFFDSCLNGAVIDNSRDITFEGCWFSNRPENGCAVTNSVDVKFLGCTFANNHKHGCLVEATSTRTRFVGCTFDSNSQASSGTYAGVAFAANTTDFVVANCYAGNGGRFTGTQGTGITVAAGTSDRYIIADNLVTGNTVVGVFDGGAGANKRVANNY